MQAVLCSCIFIGSSTILCVQNISAVPCIRLGKLDTHVTNDARSSKLASYAETDEIKKILLDMLKEVDRKRSSIVSSL